MKRVLKTGLATVIVAASLSLNAAAESITIATVNNGDMIRMQKLTDDFKKEKGTFSFFKMVFCYGRFATAVLKVFFFCILKNLP